MSHQAVATLSRMLRGHVGLGASRLETLCMLVVGMVGARTVNLGYVATEAGRDVLIASTYRRLQRFFQHVDLGPDWAAPILAPLIGSEGSWTLALDRTNWKIGMYDVNYRVLAVVTRRFRVPLFWTLIKGPGNSATATRIALMARYLALSRPRRSGSCSRTTSTSAPTESNSSTITVSLSRSSCATICASPCDLMLFARLRHAGRTQFFEARLGAREGTCLTCPCNLALLMTLVALAIAWAGRTAAVLLGQGSPKRKAHSHLA